MKVHPLLGELALVIACLCWSQRGPLVAPLEERTLRKEAGSVEAVAITAPEPPAVDAAVAGSESVLAPHAEPGEFVVRGATEPPAMDPTVADA